VHALKDQQVPRQLRFPVACKLLRKLQAYRRSQSMAATSKTTTDHRIIRKWAEERGGQPAHVKRTGGGGDPDVLRIDFPGYSGKESLEHISWEEFFEKFEAGRLALLHQEETAGGERSNFNKLVSPEQ
jgi:hypothetical protein